MLKRSSKAIEQSRNDLQRAQAGSKEARPLHNGRKHTLAYVSKISF